MGVVASVGFDKFPKQEPTRRVEVRAIRKRFTQTAEAALRKP